MKIPPNKISHKKWHCKSIVWFISHMSLKKGSWEPYQSIRKTYEKTCMSKTKHGNIGTQNTIVVPEFGNTKTVLVKQANSFTKTKKKERKKTMELIFSQYPTCTGETYP